MASVKLVALTHQGKRVSPWGTEDEFEAGSLGRSYSDVVRKTFELDQQKRFPLGLNRTTGAERLAQSTPFDPTAPLYTSQEKKS